MKTCDLLCEHAEKIVATIGLKRSMNRYVVTFDIVNDVNFSNFFCLLFWLV